MDFHFGSASYLGAFGYDFSFDAGENDQSNTIGRSRLEYPLSNLNLTIGMANQFENGFWELEGTKNLIDPTDLMVDDDWVGVDLSEGQVEELVYIPFSHTESKTELSYQKLEYRVFFKNTKTFYGKQNWLGIQVMAEYVQADVVGVENGWQDSFFDKVYFSDIFTDTTVITYEYINIELALLSQIDIPIGIQAVSYTHLTLPTTD